MRKLRVIAAMSGGVDSAVAAARAVEAGHEVVGVHLALSREPQQGTERGRGCCTLSDAHDARRSADILGIPFFVWDMSAEFADDVLDDFIAEYAAGRTPNPCMRCNEKIKFSAVLDRATDLGFDAVCTGHYARVVDRPDRTRELHRAVDEEKDQSYVLAVLTEDQLSRAMFPLGDSVKGDVRTEAADRGLLVANKPDSHDICFIPSGDTSQWLKDKLGASTGDIVDATSGEVLAQHDGAYAFTVGQRKGLRIQNPTADGSPRYVVGVDTKTNVVTVGAPTLLNVDVLEGIKLRWNAQPPAIGSECLVQIRAHGHQVSARIDSLDPIDDHIRVHLDEPFQGVAAGQALVLYQGTRVIGSATISKTGRLQRAQ